MLWRLLRIYSSTYFILGNDERHTMRLRVATPWEWQQSYKFSSFEVRAAGRGQPRVNWVASYRHLASGQRRRVGGHIEIRWSHRPFCGLTRGKGLPRHSARRGCRAIATSTTRAPAVRPLRHAAYRLPLSSGSPR